jgi:hypothetical protein
VAQLRRVGALVCLSVVALGCADGSNSSAQNKLAGASSTADPSVHQPQVRTFHVRVSPLPSGDWLTIGIHPDNKAAEVHLGAASLEVCPASLDGGIGPPLSSWPARVHFDSCQTADSAQNVTLPPTDGAAHVAFAIRARRPHPTVVDVSVRYVPSDSFLLVIPPAVQTASAEVAFTPRSTTIGAQTFTLPGFASPSTQATVKQEGHLVVTKTSCSFGSEINCVGPIKPNRPVSVRVRGRSDARARLAVYVSWA